MAWLKPQKPLTRAAGLPLGLGPPPPSSPLSPPAMEAAVIVPPDAAAGILEAQLCKEQQVSLLQHSDPHDMA